MATTDKYTLKRGETGTVLEFTLKDANGAVNLSGWTVTVTARKQYDTPVIDAGACVIAANQNTTGKGKGTYTFTSTTANIPVGVYNLEFKGVNPNNAVYYFPKNSTTKYATLTVIEPLS